MNATALYNMGFYYLIQIKIEIDWLISRCIKFGQWAFLRIGEIYLFHDLFFLFPASLVLVVAYSKITELIFTHNGSFDTIGR